MNIRGTVELGLSVVIPNHNYANYVGAAIQSALEVRWPKVEVIVVDDGSTDGSFEVIKAFGDSIIAIRQGALTRNTVNPRASRSRKSESSRRWSIP